MKSKAPLSLMEQLVMLVVFALAAALCLQIFVLSGQMSRRLETQDIAVREVQNTAEMIQISGGDAAEYAEMLGAERSGETLLIGYDAEWNKVSADAAEYVIAVTEEKPAEPLLGRAEVSAQTAEGEEIFAVTVSWQEGIDG